MRFWIFVVAIFGAAQAVPLTNAGLQNLYNLLNNDEFTRNTALEQLILNLLEDLRELMLTGTDSIPVLDPLQIETIQLDGDSLGVPGSRINLEGATVDQLSTFVVDSLNLNIVNVILQRYNLVFDGHIPVLDIHAENYDLILRALGFNIFGSGEARIRLIEPRITGTIVVRILLLSASINVETADLKFSLKGFEPEVYGLFGHEGASNFANSFLRSIVPDLVELYEDEISGLLNRIIPEIANEILGNSNLRKLLQ